MGPLGSADGAPRFLPVAPRQARSGSSISAPVSASAGPALAVLRLKRNGNRLLRPFTGPIYQRLESYETRLAGLDSYLQVLIGMMEARPRITPDVVPAKPDA